jgi:hypothetical protein
LKYVADFKDGKAKVDCKNISRKRFVSLVRKDNIVIFKTLRYSEQPLVVKAQEQKLLQVSFCRYCAFSNSTAKVKDLIKLFKEKKLFVLLNLLENHFFCVFLR